MTDAGACEAQIVGSTGGTEMTASVFLLQPQRAAEHFRASLSRSYLVAKDQTRNDPLSAAINDANQAVHSVAVPGPLRDFG